jgi:hypothetical protein
MKNIMMAVVVSVVGVQVCASDEYNFSYEKTEQGYRYLSKDKDGNTLKSTESPQEAFAQFKPSCEQLQQVMLQVDAHTKDSDECVKACLGLNDRTRQMIKATDEIRIEALRQSNDAVKIVAEKDKQLMRHKLVVGALVFGYGIIECYYWYQWYFGTQQNCPLQ